MADRVLVSSVLVSTVLEAITTHLREKRPEWVPAEGATPRVICVWPSAAEAEESRWSSASVTVVDDRPRFSDKPNPVARSVEVAPRGDVRRVTYKALADLPALCRKVEERLAEGFASEVAKREESARKQAAEDRRAARRKAAEDAHPLTFAQGARFSWNEPRLTIPEGELSVVALAAIEAHLKARQGAK
jgi:hypothetical protein